MDVLTAIDSRSSATRLVEPAPGRAELERILAAGARAPDHGKLAPWRFRVLAGPERRVLADALAAHLRRVNPTASDEQVDAARAKPLRAPAIVVVAAHTVPGHKVPEVEQLLAVGAAVQNMWLAAHALGFGAMWKTGAPAYDEGVKRALGLEPADHIVAWLYLGTPAGLAPPRAPALADRVRFD
jgi:nitroreductase